MKVIKDLKVGDCINISNEERKISGKMHVITPPEYHSKFDNYRMEVKTAINSNKYLYINTNDITKESCTVYSKHPSSNGMFHTFSEYGVIHVRLSEEELKSAKRQYKIDQRYLRMASVWSENSYCVRRQVGALLVKDRRIISDGYNGTPSGFPNVCEYIPYSATSASRDEIIEAMHEGKEVHTYSYVLHAEANAITKIAKSNNSSDGATLYVTASPCMECSKLIIQSGINRVVYSDEYRIMDGIKLLKDAGIECCFIDLKEEFENSMIYKQLTSKE